MTTMTTTTNYTPFATPGDAAYWGGGIIAPYEGGWVSLHGYSTPDGSERYTVFREGRRPGLIPGYVWAVSDDGSGRPCVCVTEIRHSSAPPAHAARRQAEGRRSPA